MIFGETSVNFFWSVSCLLSDRPKISISVIQGKYFHCTCRIYIKGNVVFHTAHLGRVDMYVDKNDERLVMLSQSKMREVLIAKYPDMFK